MDENESGLFDGQEYEEEIVHFKNMKKSKYLKKEDVGEGVIATIKEITQANVAMENQPEDIQYLLWFMENLGVEGNEHVNKAMVFKWTNIQLCVRALGIEDSDGWIGKKIVLFHDPTVSFGTKLIGGIRIRPVSPGTVTPSTPEHDEGNPPTGEFDDSIPF